jgi:hypothetical protein
MSESQESKACEVCGAETTNLRRGRCWICYLRWVESKPVGHGAACVLCNDRRHENLKMVEFRRAFLVMCHNCGAKATQLSPMPGTIEGLRQNMDRDRRWNDRRANLPTISQVVQEKRVGDRRAITDLPQAIEYTADELIIEILDNDPISMGCSETTQIAASPE